MTSAVSQTPGRYVLRTKRVTTAYLKRKATAKEQLELQARRQAAQIQQEAASRQREAEAAKIAEEALKARKLEEERDKKETEEERPIVARLKAQQRRIPRAVPGPEMYFLGVSPLMQATDGAYVGNIAVSRGTPRTALQIGDLVYRISMPAEGSKWLEVQAWSDIAQFLKDHPEIQEAYLKVLQQDGRTAACVVKVLRKKA